MMHDVEEEAPGHRRRGPIVAEEFERAFPDRRRQCLPAANDVLALQVVDVHQLLHRLWRGSWIPLDFAGLERLDDHLFLADDLPRDLAGRARPGIRAIGGVLGNT